MFILAADLQKKGNPMERTDEHSNADWALLCARRALHLPKSIHLSVHEGTGQHDECCSHDHPHDAHHESCCSHDHIEHVHEHDAVYTCFEIKISDEKEIHLTVPKKLDDITKSDIIEAKNSLADESLKGGEFLKSKIFRLGGWWLIFAGSIGLFSVCPICGRQGCPVGIGIYGILAGMLAFLKVFLKDLFAKLSSLFQTYRASGKQV